MEQSRAAVDVIAMYTAAGEIRPLRFRLEEPYRPPVRVDIERVISVREITYVGVEAQIFLCRGSVHGRNWLFELKYFFRSHSWCLLRRLTPSGGEQALPMESAWGNSGGNMAADML